MNVFSARLLLRVADDRLFYTVEHHMSCICVIIITLMMNKNQIKRGRQTTAMVKEEVMQATYIDYIV